MQSGISQTQNNLQRDALESENAMVDALEDVVELGKEMEQISEENEEDKLDKSHDPAVRSDLNE